MNDTRSEAKTSWSSCGGWLQYRPSSMLVDGIKGQNKNSKYPSNHFFPKILFLFFVILGNCYNNYVCSSACFSDQFTGPWPTESRVGVWAVMWFRHCFPGLYRLWFQNEVTSTRWQCSYLRYFGFIFVQWEKVETCQPSSFIAMF